MLIVVGREEKGVGPYLVILLGSVLGSELRSDPSQCWGTICSARIWTRSKTLPPVLSLQPPIWFPGKPLAKNLRKGTWVRGHGGGVRCECLGEAGHPHSGCLLPPLASQKPGRGYCSFLWLWSKAPRPWSGQTAQKQMIMFLFGPQGDSATRPAGLTPWKSDKPALPRCQGWSACFPSFLTVRERLGAGGSMGEAACCKRAPVKFSLQGRQYCGGVVFRPAVTGVANSTALLCWSVWTWFPLLHNAHERLLCPVRLAGQMPWLGELQDSLIFRN